MGLSAELFSRLEELVDQLLSERAALVGRNAELAAERDRLLADRQRVDAELGKLIDKLDALGCAEL
ncbi:MAG: cell division protein ZapB [Desulfuromonas sp.]|nr:MAG: cell division protein ZapB [Desulfuromonas sp.]